MKPNPALLLLTLPVAANLSVAASAPAAQVQPADNLTPGGILAAQIREIAGTKDLSQRSKSRQIASAVRLAILTVTTNLKDADQALKAVQDLAAQAAGAAPDFAEVITEAGNDAARHVPLLANVPDVGQKVQDAVLAGLKAAGVAAGEARFDTDSDGPRNSRGNDRDRGDDHEFGGRSDDVIVSPSH